MPNQERLNAAQPSSFAMNARFGIALVLVAAAIGASPPSTTAGTSQRRTPVVVHVERGGFHWLDAGLGAAATLATVLLVYGFAIALRGDGSRTHGRRRS
jgi:hypothetical protein